MDIKLTMARALERAVQEAFAQSGLTAAQIQGMLEIPPDRKLGDFAMPCFRLSKALRMAPGKIAEAVASRLQDDLVERCEVVGGYLNLYVRRSAFARETVEAVLAAGGRWGQSRAGEGKTVCLDYSSINIAKRFHIGHLSTTMIGNSLRRIYDFCGYRTVGINHLGDWGTQFGKMICAFKRWGSREEVEKGGVQAMVDLYVRFHQEAQKDPALEDEGRAWFRRIEEGDPEALEVFSWFKKVTLEDAARVYELLGVSFDSYAGESFYNDKMDAVVQELRDKGLLETSEGAQVVDFSHHFPESDERSKMPPALVLRSDGATLYMTRDLAAALYRHRTYDFEKSLYVVAYQQTLHFQQLFAILELMGHEWARGMEHVAFGMVSYEGRALSTREGYVVYLEDLLHRAVEKAREIIDEKSPNLEDKETVARQVGVGAVVYFDLHNDRMKDIDFHWDRALNFDGETGPYVQYTHARCCSVLRKAAGLEEAAPEYEALCDDEANEVLKALALFPEVVGKAMNQNEPSLITRHTTQLAQAYNKYYFEHRIMEENQPGATAARVRLTRAVRDVIRTGLWLIGVEAPERM